MRPVLPVPPQDASWQSKVEGSMAEGTEAEGRGLKVWLTGAAYSASEFSRFILRSLVRSSEGSIFVALVTCASWLVFRENEKAKCIRCNAKKQKP